MRAHRGGGPLLSAHPPLHFCGRRPRARMRAHRGVFTCTPRGPAAADCGWPVHQAPRAPPVVPKCCVHPSTEMLQPRPPPGPASRAGGAPPPPSPRGPQFCIPSPAPALSPPPRASPAVRQRMRRPAPLRCRSARCRSDVAPARAVWQPPPRPPTLGDPPLNP
ncbi:MAG: hypothetical protein J3K34DRAFT_441631 [Monoraphidium minutum]|nr:MAG: hypothetical protein J3K34DRAFT_441631 [Monoraphidium minutum]